MLRSMNSAHPATDRCSVAYLAMSRGDRGISAARYEQTDIPPGMTCDEYRWRRASSARPRGLAQSLTLALLYPARMLAHITESGPAVGARPAALHFSADLSHEPRSVLP